jgi:hypothetical protein
MMQDWADRLDLLEQGEVKAASLHLTISINGVQVLDERADASADAIESGVSPIQRSTYPRALIRRLSAAPLKPEPISIAKEAALNVPQERMDILETCKAP